MDTDTIIQDLIQEEILLALQETHPHERRSVIRNKVTGEFLYSGDGGVSGDILYPGLMKHLIRDRLKKKHGADVSLNTVTQVWSAMLDSAPGTDPFLTHISEPRITDDVPYQDDFIDLFSIRPADKDTLRLRGAVTDLFQSVIMRAEGAASWFPGNIMVIDCPDEDIRYSVHLLLTYLGNFGGFNGYKRMKQNSAEVLGIRQYRSKYYENGKILEIRIDRDIQNISRDGMFDNLQNLAVSKCKDWYPVITTIKGRGFKTLEPESWRYFKVCCEDVAFDEVISANRSEIMSAIDEMWAKAYKQDRSEYVRLRPDYSQLRDPVMRQRFDEFTKATYSGTTGL